MPPPSLPRAPPAPPGDAAAAAAAAAVPPLIPTVLLLHSLLPPSPSPSPLPFPMWQVLQGNPRRRRGGRNEWAPRPGAVAAHAPCLGGAAMRARPAPSPSSELLCSVRLLLYPSLRAYDPRQHHDLRHGQVRQGHLQRGVVAPRNRRLQVHLQPRLVPAGPSRLTSPSSTGCPAYMVPDCSFSSSCFNFTMPAMPPPGIPILDPCVVINCGQGGYCEKGANFSYQCRCQPGFKNLFSGTSMPCIDGSCTFGQDCAKLGLVNPPAAPAPAPVGNGDLY